MIKEGVERFLLTATIIVLNLFVFSKVLVTGTQLGPPNRRVLLYSFHGRWAEEHCMEVRLDFVLSFCRQSMSLYVQEQARMAGNARQTGKCGG